MLNVHLLESALNRLNTVSRENVYDLLGKQRFEYASSLSGVEIFFNFYSSYMLICICKIDSLFIFALFFTFTLETVKISTRPAA